MPWHLDEGGRVEASPEQRLPLEQARHITFEGQRVTLDRENRRTWTATGWEQGLPVARTPVTEEEVRSMLTRYPRHTLR